MKLCFVTEHYPPHVGGVETMFYEYATRLTQRGHSVRVVTSTSGGISGQRRREGVNEYHYQTFQWGGHPVLLPSTLKAHCAWADLVHTTTYTAAPAAYYASRAARKPCIITVHELLGKRWRLVEANPIKAAALRLFEYFVVSRRYEHWLAVSTATRAALVQVTSLPADRVTTLYHGIDETRWYPQVTPGQLHEFLGVQRDKKVFLFNGRLGQTKGLDVLLSAVEQINTEIGSDVIFGCLISTASLGQLDRLKKQVAGRGLASRVRVAYGAPAAALPGLRKAAWAVVVPSLTEGFGFTAAETAALGVPLVVSNADSLPEVVGGRVLFFERGSSTDLARQLLRALKGEFQLIAPKHFSWESTLDHLEELYGDIYARGHAL